MSTRGAERTELAYSCTAEVRDACLCLHVQRAARALARRFDEAFRPLDLTNGQFSLLMSLNRPEPPSIGSVASLLAMDRTTLTAALKPLVRRGLVTISVDKKDRRTRLLSIRPAGRALLAKGLPLWRQTHRELERDVAQPTKLRAALLALARHD
jgi:DNA-binding MarR family transcriptional regulator